MAAATFRGAITMRIPTPPSANIITIAQALELLDNNFAAMAAATERRGFTFCVGSGISRGRAPDVGRMLKRALEHLRQRADPNDANCKFRRALREALGKNGIDAGRLAKIQLDLPLEEWSESDEIISASGTGMQKYSTRGMRSVSGAR
jgi:hypothetical protein